jgi:hypothetical protein
MMDQVNVLRRAEQALVDLDAQALVACYASEFLFEDTSSRERITSKQDLLGYFDRLFSLPDVSFSGVSFYALGDRAAGQWVWGGSSLGSGSPYAIRGASLFRLGEEGIQEELIFYDPRPAYD